MNHVYRVVFNRHTATRQAVAEICKGQHKGAAEASGGTVGEVGVVATTGLRAVLWLLGAGAR